MTADMDTTGEHIPRARAVLLRYTPHIVYDDASNIVGMDMMYHNNADNVLSGVLLPTNGRLLVRLSRWAYERDDRGGRVLKEV